MSDTRRDRLSIFLLALVVAAFFLPALLSPGLLIWPHSGLGSDIGYRHWPDLVSYARGWSAGRVVLWDSFVALGRPLAGDPTVLFLYPFGAVFAWLPPALAFSVLDALHVFLAGLWMFLLLRLGYGTSPPASLLGALTFAFSPKFIAHLAGGHVGLVWGVAWAPAVLLGLKLAFEGRTVGAALAGFAMALQMPTHLQIPYYTAVVSSAYWVWHLAPQLWRALRGRREAWTDVRRYLTAYLVWLASFVLSAAVVLLPLLELLPYNSRGNFGLDDANLYALPPLLLITLLVPTNFQFPEWTMFVGLVPLLLGGLGVYTTRRHAWLFFALLAAFALIYALGTSTPLFSMAFNLVPGFRMLRVPTRLWFFGGLAVAVLAGFGADAAGDAALRDRLRRSWRWLAGAAVIYLAGGLIAWGAYRVVFQRWHEPMFVRLLVAAAAAGLGLAWLGGRSRGQVTAWLLVPLLLFDLLPLDAAHIELRDPGTLFLRTSPAFDYVAAQAGIFRVYSPAGDLSYAAAAEKGVETLEGLLAFQIGHSVRAVREAAGCLTVNYATAIPACLTDKIRSSVPDAAHLGRLNVRYVLSHEPLDGTAFKRVLAGQPSVYENLVWQPRARLTAGGEAEIESRGAGTYEIRIAAEAPGRLVVAETWLPGWQAVVDGRPRPVQQVEGALLGVEVGPGDQVVRLQYNPLGWRLGWPLSLASFIALLVWSALTWRRKRP